MESKNNVLGTKRKFVQPFTNLLIEENPERLVKCYHEGGHSEWWYRKNTDGSEDFYGTEENTTPILFKDVVEMAIGWYPLFIVEI